METAHSIPDVWHNCYEDSWDGFIVPEAFTHPAKFSRGLIARILVEMRNAGMLKKGDSIVDPFGGIGTGGIVAASMGFAWFGCELESKFHLLGQQNFALHAEIWRQFGDPLPVLVNGDSRKLMENLSLVLPAAAAVSSPPYNLPFSQDHNGSKGGKRSSGTAPSSEPGAFTVYGNSPGQLEGLPMGGVDAVCSSPPYEEGLGHKGVDKHPERARNNSTLRQMNQYGGYNLMSPDNLGNVAGETFWSAARTIVAECHAILKPGGYSAWVVKDFIRNKQRVPFCDDWSKLLKACGFTIVTRVRTMLLKEQKHPDLFGGDHHVKRTERKSFFRRLYEQKYPENSIDWEEVVFAQRNQ